MLRPSDLAVALRIRFFPDERYQDTASALHIGTGSAHRSVQRLLKAGVLFRESRKTNLHRLYGMICWGAPQIFFPSVGSDSIRGIATALDPEEDGPGQSSGFVWPSEKGDDIGTALKPLYPKCILLPTTDRVTYEALCLFDTLRVGSAGARQRAQERLREIVIDGARTPRLPRLDDAVFDAFG